MKRYLITVILVMAALATRTAAAYDFSAVAPSGQTLFYSMDSYALRVKVVSPLEGSYYSYVSGDLIIPDSVTYDGTTYPVACIDYHAFHNCSGLTSVTIPDNVTTIRGYSFYGCSGLDSITLPEAVSTIEYNAFENCSGLAYINIPDNVTQIDSYAFYGCNALKKIIFPSMLTTIGINAFENCSGLDSIVIPASLTSIGNQAFSGCSGLTFIAVDEDNAVYDSRGGCNAIIQTDLNLLIQGCSMTVIPSGITAIGNNAFQNCGGLGSVGIPGTVVSIGDYAFYSCTDLASVTIPASVISIGNSAFYGCKGPFLLQPTTPPTLAYAMEYTFGYSKHVYVPCGAEEDYKNASKWSSGAYYIHGTTFLDYSCTFGTNNEEWGTVHTDVMDCDSNIYVYALAKSGYQLAGWSDGGAVGPRTFHITQDTSVCAIFDRTTYAILGQPDDTAHGTVTGSDTVYFGDTVTLDATAKYGYHFVRWDDWEYVNPRSIRATCNMALTAHFAPDTFSVTVLTDDASKGSAGGSGTTIYRDSLYIYALPATGYHFCHWSDGDSNAWRYLTVTQDTVLTAYFERNNYFLTAVPNDSTLGSVTGGGTFEHGASVTVTATSTQGNRFDHWSDGSYFANHTFLLVSDLLLVAVFVPIDTVHVHDTTYITQMDTVTLTVHDTVILTVYDTVDHFIHDTTTVCNIDTLWIFDTVFVHDTVYVGIDEVKTLDAKIYCRDGQVVVEGAEGNVVALYEMNGRLLATRRDEGMPLCFDVPASGAYLVRIGHYAARRVVVIR